MAEEQKDKKTGGVDGFFANLQEGLNKAARGESKLVKAASLGIIGGDKEVADKVDKLGIDKMVALPGTLLERAVVTPVKMVASLDAGVKYVGTRIGASLANRRRYAAEMYLKKEGGPWGKKGLIYGNADRIAESSPKYEEAYLGERNTAANRDRVYTQRRDALNAEIKLSRAAGNRTQMRIKQAELRDLNSRKRNPALSAARVTPVPGAAVPPKDELDDVNITLLDRRRDLAAQRAAFLPRVPIFRQLKKAQMERAVRHKERKTNLAKNIMANSPGLFKMEDYRTKRRDLKIQIKRELASPYRDKARLADYRAKLKDLESTISHGEHIVAGIFGDRAV